MDKRKFYGRLLLHIELQIEIWTMKLEFDKSDYLNVGAQPLAASSFINWSKLLIENRFCVDWQFIPKALYVTLMISILTPFRFYEKIKFDKKVKQVKILSPIFIIGHFRSGTTFLHYLMAQDKDLSYVSTMETAASWTFLGSGKLFTSILEKNLPEKRPVDDLELGAHLPYEEEYALANFSPYSYYHGWYFPKRIDYYFKKFVLFEGTNDEIIRSWKKFYYHLLKKITYKHGKKQILLKNPVNTGRIKLLLETFPDAKFIHIYRNPFKVYLSIWRLYKTILPAFSFQHIDSKKLDKFIIEFYKSLYTKYFEEKKFIPENNLIEIRYEDFVKEPVKILKSVYEKLGMDGFEDARPTFEKYAKKHEDYKPYKYKIDKNIKKKIYKEWEFAFKEFGYN